MFNAPIPGESLTTPMGASPWHSPPQYTTPEEAADKIFDAITQPRQTIKIVAMLSAGIPAEMIARTLIFAGFTQGKWIPDVSLLIARPVLYMVVGVGHRAGVKNMKIMLPDDDMDSFMNTMSPMIDATKFVSDEDTISSTEDKPTNLFGGLN